MKREIKFRVFDNSSKKMNQVHSIWGLPKVDHITIPSEESVETLFNNFELMQFTGLKDKNGIDIYEGDIIRYFNLSGELAIGIIVFKDGSFRFKNTNNQEVRQWNDGNHDWYSIENIELFEMEIIGNIYENPEFLNK